VQPSREKHSDTRSAPARGGTWIESTGEFTSSTSPPSSLAAPLACAEEGHGSKERAPEVVKGLHNAHPRTLRLPPGLFAGSIVAFFLLLFFSWPPVACTGEYMAARSGHRRL
jgi:hypothetical protein